MPRPPKHLEESVGRYDYVERLTELGPREAESLLSFRARLAGIIEGRSLLAWAVTSARGTSEEAARLLGVDYKNLAAARRRFGISPEMWEIECNRALRGRKASFDRKDQAR
jgi:hypothetical protein